MTALRYPIPFFQPLPPGDLIAGKGDLRGTFPFSAPRVHHFYMARNAIWHGLDLLGVTNALLRDPATADFFRERGSEGFAALLDRRARRTPGSVVRFAS